MAEADPLIAMFRARGGVGIPRFGDRLLLLITKGARSGRQRENLVTYHRDEDRYVIVASNAAADGNPSWFTNLLADPNVVVEVAGVRFPAVAAVVEGEEGRRLFDDHARLMPAFREYQERTYRVIPAVILTRAD